MSKQQSVMSHQFSRVPKAEIPRSSFDRSHGVKTTLNAGFLIPILVDEGLPGDSFNVKLDALARLNTPIFPTMDNMFLETFFFAVPVRLVWDNWEKFNGSQADPGDSTDYVIPQTESILGYGEQTISDYFGIPPGIAQLQHSVLWHRAYNLIWNEWFRDQNLQDSVPVNNESDGPDLPTDYQVLKRGKRHDYFTSALPWPQKSDDPVLIPLGTSAPIRGVGQQTSQTGLSGPLSVRDTADGLTTYDFYSNNHAIEVDQAAVGASPLIFADLTDATAVTPNVLRQAFQIQKQFERDARGGTRYTEVIKASFGVTSPDARLQRPEFLGGGSTPINIVPVPSTVPDATLAPQGNLAGYGTANVHNHGFTKSFTEHVLILGLVNIRADITYQQGLNRMFSRTTRFDHFWPALGSLGEQEIKNKEIFMIGKSGDAGVQDETTFGYQERYAEYRYKPSLITGLMRSSADQSLDAWHLAQDFQNLPVLNSTFIEDQPPIARIVAVPTEPDFTFDGFFSMRTARPMPLYGVPGLIDHF